MNSIEETLWNYIDGNCTPAEQQAITALIAGDEAYRLKYQELLALSRELSMMEVDEPSMAFTYNVMETIRTEHAKVPLKAAINKKIIIGITVFFTVTVAALLIFAFASVDWSVQSLPVNLTANLKMPDISAGTAKVAVQAFVFFDVILGLYLIDKYLRKKSMAKNI